MASQTVTTMICDMSGETEDVETVTFAFMGVNYEIDLAEESRSVFGLMIKEYVDNARVVVEDKPPVKAKAAGKKTKTNEAAQIREWAKANGVEVNERGRIPAEVREAYETAVLANAEKQLEGTNA